MSPFTPISRVAGWGAIPSPGGGWFLDGDGVHVLCGLCGRHAGALTDHSISEDGVVRASILAECCEWHVWGILVGWAHGRKAAGERLPEGGVDTAT